jgi:hypothetical protein
MKLNRVIVSLVAAAALTLVACGDDKDSSTDSNGGGDNHGLAGTTISQSNIGQAQAVVFQGLGTAAAKGPGTHNGAKSGTVTISYTLGKPVQSMKYKLVFDNYSDDGQAYLDGTVQYNLSGTTMLYTFDLTVSGAYSGVIKGEVSAVNGAYTGYWIVNGTRINF